MVIKQVSVFLENKGGRLYSLTKTIADAGIDIKAISIAESEGFGIVRMVVDDYQKAVDILRSAGFRAEATDVLAVSVEDRPGGLAEVLNVVNSVGANVEYMYGFVAGKEGKALLVFRFDAGDLERAADALKGAGIKVVRECEL